MFVLFLTPGPSKTVPVRLYYVDGRIWEDSVENATHFDSRDVALAVQGSLLDSFDTQIQNLDDAIKWEEEQAKKRG